MPWRHLSILGISHLLLGHNFCGPKFFQIQNFFRAQNFCPAILLDTKQILKVGSWEHLEQIPTVTMTFVQETFVLATFVHIRNISAVSDLILTKM